MDVTQKLQHHIQMLFKSYNTVYRCYLGVTTPYIDVIKELQRCLIDVIYVSDPHTYIVNRKNT